MILPYFKSFCKKGLHLKIHHCIMNEILKEGGEQNVKNYLYSDYSYSGYAECMYLLSLCFCRRQSCCSPLHIDYAIYECSSIGAMRSPVLFLFTLHTAAQGNHLLSDMQPAHFFFLWILTLPQGRGLNLCSTLQDENEMKEIKLPNNLYSQLNKLGIPEEAIVCVGRFDIDNECAYCNGYILLTKADIIVCTAPLPYKSVIYFKGTQSLATKDDDFMTYEIKKYDLSKVENPHVEHLVATNNFVCCYEGIDTLLVSLSNLHLEGINAFIKKVTAAMAGDYSTDEECDNETERDESLYCPKCGMMYPDPKEAICPNCTNKRSIFLRILKYFFKYKSATIALFLLYIVSAVINIAWPYLSGTVLYTYVLGKDRDFLARFGLENNFILALGILVILMIGCKLIQEGTGMLQMVLMARIASKTVRDIKNDIFASMGNLSVNFFTSKQTGGLMTRVISDADRVTGFFLDGLPYIFIHGMTIIVTFVIMFILNWPLALASCILIPLLVFMSVKLKPALWGLFGRRHRAEKAVTARVNDNLTGARVVKAFGQGNAEIEKFESPNENLRQAEVDIVKYNNRFTILYEFVQEISSIWVWLLGVFLVLETHSIDFGVLLTFTGYVSQLNGPMNFFSRVFHMWSDSINSAQRMFEIIDAIPEIKEKDNPVRLDNPNGEIVLEHVTFGYDANKPVIHDMNLHIKSGELLGIVGRSGAGKTTLVNLISRLYDVNEGKVLIDGHNVKDLAFNDLRKNVAMVSQDTYIFMGTVAENIAYANENASRADIIRAAKLASAHEFICKMPDGYDTFIGASGKDLSGGEKQRISIARAILANPKILILDEATASVDTETEKAIQASINYLVKGRTTLSIAHRLSTLRDADRLIVIDNGSIIEEGTGEELDALGGTYHKLLELQTKSLALKEIEEF